MNFNGLRQYFKKAQDYLYQREELLEVEREIAKLRKSKRVMKLPEALLSHLGRCMKLKASLGFKVEMRKVELIEMGKKLKWVDWLNKLTLFER